MGRVATFINSIFVIMGFSLAFLGHSREPGRADRAALLLRGAKGLGLLELCEEALDDDEEHHHHARAAVLCHPRRRLVDLFAIHRGRELGRGGAPHSREKLPPRGEENIVPAHSNNNKKEDENK
jgi:hypothetical protein